LTDFGNSEQYFETIFSPMRALFESI